MDINDSMLWAQDTRGYENLMVMDDMKDSGSWAQGSRCYEQLIVVGDMNDLVSHDLRPLDAMNSLRLRIISMILGHEPMSPNVMNNSRL